MRSDTRSTTRDRTAIGTTAAPAPAGTYSQAIAVAGLVFVSGQTPRLTTGERLLDAPFDEQVDATLRNLAAVAEAAGSSLALAAHLTVFLRNPKKAAEFDTIYRGYVGSAPPARTLVQSDLTVGELEVNAILALSDPAPTQEPQS